jgi:rhodanese-related sulfurtransferase
VAAVGESLPEVPAAGVPDDAWLLDVREDDEWAAGHVPGATHVPLGQLGARTAEVPQDQQIYVICRSGIRSARAAQALNGAGWQALNVAGGMQDWAAAGRPMMTDSGATPFVA